MTDGFTLNDIDAANPDLQDQNTIPNHIQLSTELKMCLQENELEHVNIGRDLIKIFESTITSIGLDKWPKAIK